MKQPRLFRFVAMNAFDRQTDGQTDRNATATARSKRVECALETDLKQTRNTFCGTWYLPHSHVYNERTVPIIMAGCMAHEREGYISTSGLKYDVTIVFLDPDFL